MPGPVLGALHRDLPKPLESPAPLCRRGPRVQRRTVTCPRPHSQLTAEQGPAPGQLTPAALPAKRLGRSLRFHLAGWPSACLLLHMGLFLPQDGAVRPATMASLGTRWGSLGTPSPVGGASAAGTWTPTPWATATPCPATACVACSTRQVLAASAVRKASTAARWPRGPRTSVCVSSHPRPAALPRLCGFGRVLAFSVACPESDRVCCSPRSPLGSDRLCPAIFLLPWSLALSSLSTGSTGDCPDGLGTCHIPPHPPGPRQAVVLPSLPTSWLARSPVPPLRGPRGSPPGEGSRALQGVAQRLPQTCSGPFLHGALVSSLLASCSLGPRRAGWRVPNSASRSVSACDP